jgi:hypothetical protein
MCHRVSRADPSESAPRGGRATSLPAVRFPTATLVLNLPAREGWRSSCRQRPSINCLRAGQRSQGSVRQRLARCAGLTHLHPFDYRRAVLARAGCAVTPPTAKPMRQSRVIQVLLSASSRQSSCLGDCAMIDPRRSRRQNVHPYVAQQLHAASRDT